MTTTADSTDRDHPIGVGLSRIEEELKTLRDQPAWSMGTAQTRDVMVRLTRAKAAMSELEARAAAHGQAVGVEAASGATSTANWWAHATRQTRAAAHRKTRLATALGSEVFEPVRVALAEGRLLVDQAQVIIAAVQALPEDIDPAIRDDALATLIGYAVHHDAKALRILGRRILDVVAPEVGEAHEVKVLEREEREAEAAAVFRMHEDGHGKAHGRFTIPAGTGRELRSSCWRSPRRSTGQRGRPGTSTRAALGAPVGGGVLRAGHGTIPLTQPRRRAASRPPWW